MNDPIADMLTRIRNAVATRKESVEFPTSKMKNSILEIMKEEGFIFDFQHSKSGIKSFTEVILKYDANNDSIINGLSRVSTPGLRSYAKKGEIPTFLGGLAVSVMSTSKGVMTGKKAFKSGLGGEIICYIW